MMRKLLLVFCLFAYYTVVGQEINLTTTSISPSWSPRAIVNNGSTLVWQASNALIGTQIQNVNVPVFDFSSNDGSPIAITVSSVDNLSGLTRFQVYSLNITEIDLTAATALTNVHLNNNQISSIDISTLTNLNLFRASQNQLTSVDISNNPLLTYLEISNNLIGSTNLDGVINQLDIFGLSNGSLFVGGNVGITENAQPSYDNLVSRNWTIDAPAPQAPVVETITIITTSNSATWSPQSIVNSGNILQWTASGASIPTQTQTVNDPTFNFNSNNGSPITITITNTDGFSGLTRFQAYTRNITSIDLTAATALTNVHINNNQISSVDISMLTSLNLFRASQNRLTTIDISSNPLLTYLEISNNLIGSTILDGIISQLDIFGLSNGSLFVGGNVGITENAQPSYDNLIAKNWTIDAPAPQAPVVETITIITTSNSATWSPQSIVNSGNVLQWTASGASIATQTLTVNDPTFNFSANNGSPITITISSSDGFSGLTRFQAYTRNITSIDLTTATALTNVHIGNNQLSSVELSTLTNLNLFRAGTNNLTTIDISNNPLLTFVELVNNDLTTSVLNGLVNQLDVFGLSNGTLNISGNESLTMASQPAFDNLITKNWTIDVPAPQPPVLTTLSITTTSNSATWSPQSITNTGAILTWEASGASIATQTQTVNDPTFDFSANNGSPITITVTSTDGFSGLTRFQAFTRNITSIDLTAATALTNVHIGNNQLSTVNISTLTNLNLFRAGINNLTTINISNNPLLTFVELVNNDLTTSVLDGLVNQLDVFGLSNGTLNITGNESLTMASQPAFDNLITKNWTIDVPAPQPPVLTTLSITTTSNSATWSPQSITNTGAILTWEASGASIATQTQTVNDPTFDFSANNGSPITITVTSTDGFSGLTRFQAFTRNITSIDLTAATALTNVHIGNNQLSTVNISTLTNLNLFRAGINNLTTINISNNPLLTFVELVNNDLTTSVLDGLVNQLDVFGLSNGTLNITGNESLTMASQPAFDNLITKNWTIDVPAPQPPVLTTLSITTTSNSATWSPQSITNTGAILTWEASGASIATQTQTVNDPTFDFSANNGSPITITVTSTDGFSGLTRFQAFTRNITSIDLTAATALTNVHIGNNQLSTVNISTLTNLNLFRAGINNLTTIDISNNPLLTFVELVNNDLTTSVLNGLVNQLDVFGLSNGTLNIAGNEVLSSAAQPAYDNLITKNWTIDVDAPLAAGPHIQVTGNSISITSSGAANLADGTAFGETTLGNPITQTFVINNIGSEDLNLGPLFISTSTVFPITSPVSNLTIPAGGSEFFEVTFNPITLGLFQGSIFIQTNDPDFPAFVINVSGEAVQVLSNQIMITQYYKGFAPNDRWIEVKNISGAPIAADIYYLALFNQTLARAGVIEGSIPTSSIAIPALASDETILFRNASAALPAAGNIGTAAQIALPVNFAFDGDDVILISTSNTASSYNLRVDMMGNISSGEFVNPDVWGNNTCLIKGGCSSEEAHKTFNINDWTTIALVDVDNALSNTNLALGTQVVGPTTTTDGLNWSNLDPDLSRTAVVSSSVTGAGETFFACNLIINSGVDVIFDSNGATSNSIVLYGDLTVNGSLTIGDTESLVTLNNGAALGSITKIEKSQAATSIYDATYWSSPVSGQQLSTVFAGVDPNRIFEFKAGEENPKYLGTDYKYWWLATGAMEQAKGYSADATSLGVQTITFTGIPYNGSFNKDMFFSGTIDTGTANENFNLIGNPYPAAIDVKKFLDDNAVVNEIALWAKDKDPNPDGTFDPAGYIYYSTTGTTTPGVTQNIGSGQGFMARSVDFGTVNFNNGLKLVGQNTQFYKSAISKNGNVLEGNLNRIWLKLKDGKVKSNILIGFLEEATDGLDLKYDAFGGLDNTNIRLYSQIGDSKLAIQALGSFSPEKSVSLGFEIKEAKELTLSINGLEGVFAETDFYLVDHVLNKSHNLKEGDYKFNQTTTGDFPNRFTLQFSKNALDVDKIIQGSEFSVFNSGEGFRINASKVVKEVNVYDMLGRTIINSKPEQQSFYLNAGNLKTGAVLIFEVKLENGTILNKKAIKM